MYCLAFWSSPRFVRYRGLSNECVASAKLVGALSEFVFWGTWAVLGKFYSLRILCRIFLRRVKHLFAIYIYEDLSVVVGLRSTKRYPYGLRTASSYSLINRAVSFGYVCFARVKICSLSRGFLKRTKWLFKVAQDSFQHFPRCRVWWVIITTLHQLMLQPWYQKTAQSLVNTLVLFSWHNRWP